MLKNISFLLLLSSILNAQLVDFGTYGKTYEIAEEDYYLKLKERFEKFQSENNVSEQLKSIVLEKYISDSGLKSCKEDKVIAKELIYTVEEDVIFQGVKIFEKGYSFNILERMPLNGYMLIVNFKTDAEKNKLYQLVADEKRHLRIDLLHNY